MERMPAPTPRRPARREQLLLRHRSWPTMQGTLPGRARRLSSSRCWPLPWYGAPLPRPGRDQCWADCPVHRKTGDSERRGEHGLPTSYQIISMLHAAPTLRRSHNPWNQSSSSYGALSLRLSTISAWIWHGYSRQDTVFFAEALSKCSRLQDCSRFPWRMGEKGEKGGGRDVTPNMNMLLLSG